MRPLATTSYLTALCAVALLAAGTAARADDDQELPEFKDIEAAIAKHFAAQKGYKPNDLLSQGDIKPLFPKLKELGWELPVAEQSDLLKHVLPDNDFIVRELSTKQGTAFMRRVSKNASAYDRLTRLAAMQHGQRLVRRAIRDKDGYKMIQYMTTTKAGRNLGKQLSKTPSGKNFNAKTGVVYTETQLTEQLQQYYQAARARRAKQEQPAS